jgi:hypothetical protein
LAHEALLFARAAATLSIMKHTLKNYTFGSVFVDDCLHTKDLVINKNGVVPNWRRKTGHSLVPEDIESLLPEDVQTLIIGCGSPGMLVVPKETADWCKENKIALVALPTEDACRRYNDIPNQDFVVIGLHLTC